MICGQIWLGWQLLHHGHIFGQIRGEQFHGQWENNCRVLLSRNAAQSLQVTQLRKDKQRLINDIEIVLNKSPVEQMDWRI